MSSWVGKVWFKPWGSDERSGGRYRMGAEGAVKVVESNVGN